MKLIKYLLIAVVFMGTNVLQSSPKEVKILCSSHSAYIANECGNSNVRAIVGYRMDLLDCTLDISAGFASTPVFLDTINQGKVSLAIFRTIYSTDGNRIYGGVGGKFLFQNTYMGSRNIFNDKSIGAFITLGKEFNISDRNNIFVEVSYSPISWLKNNADNLNLKLGFSL